MLELTDRKLLGCASSGCKANGGKAQAASGFGLRDPSERNITRAFGETKYSIWKLESELSDGL